jgi:hypothetical protein
MTKTPSNLQDPKSGGIRQGEDGRGRSGCGVGLGLETRIESASDGRRHISLAVKRAGEPSAGNRHARFDVAGAGNQLTARIVRHSQRKRRVTARPSLRSKRRQSPTLQAGPTEQRRQSSTLLGNERVLQERRERIHLGPESCGGHREAPVEA